MIIVAGTATVHVEKIDNALPVIAKMVEATEQEDGCISYRIYQDPNSPTTFFIFEQWDSEEALARHFQTEHMAEFSAQLPILLSAPMDIKRYDVSSVKSL